MPPQIAETCRRSAVPSKRMKSSAACAQLPGRSSAGVSVACSISRVWPFIAATQRGATAKWLRSCWLKVEKTQLWGGLRRAPEATASFQAAKAASLNPELARNNAPPEVHMPPPRDPISLRTSARVFCGFSSLERERERESRSRRVDDILNT